MGKAFVQFPNKEPYEIVPYTFDLSKNSAFASNSETITSATCAVYNRNDPDTLVPAMIYAISYSGNLVQCDIGNSSTPDTEGTYIVRIRVVCSSGRRYEEQGIFTVKELA